MFVLLSLNKLGHSRHNDCHDHGGSGDDDDDDDGREVAFFFLEKRQVTFIQNFQSPWDSQKEGERETFPSSILLLPPSHHHLSSQHEHVIAHRT